METCEPASLNTSGAVRYTGISVTQVCYTGISACRWTRATRYFTRVVLYTLVDAQSDKLVNVDSRKYI